MWTTSRGTDFKRLPTSLFCLLIVINYAKATIDYTAFRNDTISQETKPENARTIRTILEELIQRNITSGDHIQHGTEHLLQYGALLRTQILDTFGKLVYDHYDDFGMSQIEALYRVYRETLERKYNIFDIVPSVLNNPDTRPTKICAYINDHVTTCLKESSKICMNINIHNEPNEGTLSKSALNVTRHIYELAEISNYYPLGFSPAAVLKYLKSGRLRFTPVLFSGLLHNAQYDSFDDKVRTAERELVLFLTNVSRKFSKETETVSTSARSVSELLKNYLTSGEKIFTGKALRHAIYLAEHVIREVDAISENIEWLGTVYDNSTINLKYLFELILPNDTMDMDIVDARNYLLHQIKDKKIMEKYLRIEKYQQAGPDQLLMEIFGQLRDIHFAEDLVTSLYTHARFWHKSHMIENLDELLELFDAYDNLRGVPEYQEFLQNADQIKRDLEYSKNVTVELLCSRPRTCLRIGLEMVKNCAAIDEQTKIAIDVFTNASCQCSCLEPGLMIRITNDTELDESMEESSSTPVGTEIPGDILKITGNTTTESFKKPSGLTPRPLEKDSPNDDDDILGTGATDDGTPSKVSLALAISPKSKPDNSTEITPEPLTVKLCGEDCSSIKCIDSDCETQGNLTNIPCEGSDCNKTYCEASDCIQANCEEGNCTTDKVQVDSRESSSCDEDNCEGNFRSESDCEGPDCSTGSCEGDNCQDNSVPESGDPSACDGPECEDNPSSESTCKSPTCEDNSTPPNVCEGPDCEDDMKANWTVSTEKTPCLGPDCPFKTCVGNDCKDQAILCEGPNCSNVSCDRGDCLDDSDDSSACEGPDCKDDTGPNGTVSTEKTPCLGPDCPPESCVGNNCQDSAYLCEGPNCSNISCEGGYCSNDPDNSSVCKSEECKDNSQLNETGSTAPCEGPNCFSVESLEHCESSNCSTVPEVECEEDECSKELKEGECQTPDCKDTGIPLKPEKIGCQGMNCANQDCKGPDCLIKVIVDCEGANCTNTNCTGPNCAGEARIDCGGPNCSHNNCTGPNCLGDGTMTECETSDCLDNKTSDCSGSDCLKINCTGPDCLGDVSNTNCTGPDCPGRVPVTVCQGPDCLPIHDICMGSDCATETSYENCNGPDCPSVPSEEESNCEDGNCSNYRCEGASCDKVFEKKVPSNSLTEDQSEDKCEGENCGNDTKILCEGIDCPTELTPAPDDVITGEPCLTDNCTTVGPTIEDNCEGANCTGNSTKEDSSESENEKKCEGEDCKRNDIKPCEGNACIIKFFKKGDKQVTEELCLGDNCMTISPTSEVDCEGVNCTSNSTEVELKNIENQEDCKGGICERDGKKPCKSDECIDELPEKKDETITKEPCSAENCTSGTFSPNKEIEQTSVPTEYSVQLAPIGTPAVKRIITFCGNSDPHYRRRRNRLRKMRLIDALTSTPKYQGWNNLIFPSVTEETSKKVDKYSNTNVNENSSINVNAFERAERTFGRKDQKKNPLLQVLGDTTSTSRNSKTNKNNGRKNAQLREKDDKAMKVSEIEETSKNSFSPNRTEVKIKKSKQNNSDYLAIGEIDAETNSRKIIRQKKIQLKDQEEGLRSIGRADSDTSSFNKSHALQSEEDKLEEEIKKNDQEILNLRRTEKAATKKERNIDEEENSKKEMKKNSEKVEKSAVKKYRESSDNDKVSEKRRTEVLKTRWHKLGSKLIRKHKKSDAKSMNKENRNEQTQEATQTKLKKVEKSRGKSYGQSVSNDKLSKKQRKYIFRTKWHTFKNKVNKNQRRNATKSTHEQDDKVSIIDDEMIDEEEAQTTSPESQKGWKKIQRGSSNKTSVKTTNEGNAKRKKVQSTMKTKAGKIHSVLNGRHGWKEVLRNGSAKYEEEETEKQIQDDSRNLRNGWKILKRGNAQESSIQTTEEERAKGKENPNTKTKLKFQKGLNEIQRTDSTTNEGLSQKNGSQSHEDASLEDFVYQRGVVKSKSKMIGNSRKTPIQWLKKQRVKRKHRSRGGDTWEEKTLMAKELRTHRAEPTSPEGIGKGKLSKHVSKVQNEEEKITDTGRLLLAYQADTRNTEPSVLKEGGYSTQNG